MGNRRRATGEARPLWPRTIRVILASLTALVVSAVAAGLAAWGCLALSFLVTGEGHCGGGWRCGGDGDGAILLLVVMAPFEIIGVLAFAAVAGFFAYMAGWRLLRRGAGLPVSAVTETF